MSLPNDRQIILTGAQYLRDPYKGFSLFLDTLPFLDLQSYFVVIYGNTASVEIPIEDYCYATLGFLRSPHEMRVAYSAADVLVVPSKQEAFGKVIVESMACGTPVVCLDTGGARDMVTHKVDGYLATSFDVEDVTCGVKWLIRADTRDPVRQRALTTVASRFDIAQVARSYAQLYRELVHNESIQPID